MEKKNEKKKHQPHVKRQAITEEQLMWMMNQIETDATEKARNNCTPKQAEQWKFTVQLLCVLLYTTGLRIHEALALDICDIARLFNEQSVPIYISKTESNRELLLTRGELRLWHKYFDQEAITNLPPGKAFKSMTGTLLTVKSASRYLQPYFNTLHQQFSRSRTENLPGCTYGSHSFRISYITRTNKYMGLEATRKRIGHKSALTTNEYIRVGDMRTVVDEMNRKGG